MVSEGPLEFWSSSGSPPRGRAGHPCHPRGFHPRQAQSRHEEDSGLQEIPPGAFCSRLCFLSRLPLLPQPTAVLLRGRGFPEEPLEKAGTLLHSPCSLGQGPSHVWGCLEMVEFTSSLSLSSGLLSCAAAGSLEGKAHPSFPVPTGGRRLSTTGPVLRTGRNQLLNVASSVQWPQPCHPFRSSGDGL